MKKDMVGRVTLKVTRLRFHGQGLNILFMGQFLVTVVHPTLIDEFFPIPYLFTFGCTELQSRETCWMPVTRFIMTSLYSFSHNTVGRQNRSYSRHFPKRGDG